MRGNRLALLALCVLWALPGTAQDPMIESLVEAVSLDRMYTEVDALVAFGTRRSDQPEGFQAQDWLYARFAANRLRLTGRCSSGTCAL